MRKAFFLLLVPTLLLVSGKLFAQDASSFEENFSLSTQLETHVLFWNPEISSIVSNSFIAEKKTYHTLNLAYQIHENHQFLERIHPFRNSTSNNAYNCKYKLQEEQRFEMSSPSLAEGYLKRLAERKKKSRRTWGAIGLIGGGICLGLGAATLSSVEEEAGWGAFWEAVGESMAGTMLVATGVMGVVVGTLSLAIPSSAERELEDVLKISDAAQRKRACQDALSSLAARGKKSRILSCILLAGVSAYSLFSKERDYYSAGTFGAFAVYSLIRKTPEERAFQNYQKVREQQKKLGFHLGIGPHGGVKVGLSLSY